ncbi:hypothetical protein V7O62_06995 [Methanolobus sp. ZRKC2]|uniref:hypothetical protein n=1 Tax=Methanolobus sp. ZRKC2 TaxID=3125783 RepID=UPI0032480AF7
MVLCLCLTPLAMASVEEEKDDAQLKIEELEAELGEEGMQEVKEYLELQASLPDVVKGMPYSGLAFAATRPESQTVYMGYIDNFDVSEKEKKRYKTGLQDVWDRYPFNITEEDYPFMAELGPMIEAEAFSIYTAEELEAMRNTDMPEDLPEIKADLFRLHENEEYLEMEDSLPDVVTNMPYGRLAFAAHVPEDQVEIIRYIDNAPIPEEVREEYKTKIQDIWDRYPDEITEDDYLFMSELGLITTSSALEEEQIVREEDSSSLQFADTENEQKKEPGFTGIIAFTAIVLCFYLTRRK